MRKLNLRTLDQLSSTLVAASCSGAGSSQWYTAQSGWNNEERRPTPNFLSTPEDYCSEPTHHYIILWSGDRGQHVDAVSREVPSQFGPVIDAMRPARVHHMLSIVFIQDDQIALGKTQEVGIYPGCQRDDREISGSALRLILFFLIHQ